MKKITIAFDVDGTLRDNTAGDRPIANERIRTLLVSLASFKNTKIIVWSGCIVTGKQIGRAHV